MRCRILAWPSWHKNEREFLKKKRNKRTKTLRLLGKVFSARGVSDLLAQIPTRSLERSFRGNTWTEHNRSLVWRYLRERPSRGNIFPILVSWRFLCVVWQLFLMQHDKLQKTCGNFFFAPWQLSMLYLAILLFAAWQIISWTLEA